MEEITKMRGMYPAKEDQEGNEDKKNTGQKTGDTYNDLLDSHVTSKPANQSPPRLPLQSKQSNENEDEEG
jgi:hypothetical protein